MRWAAFVLLGLAAAAGAPVRAQLPPGFTRSGVEGASTAELARRLLGAGAAERAERHSIGPMYIDPSPLEAIAFYFRPTPLAEDICGRSVAVVHFSAIDFGSKAGRQRDAPVRVESIGRGVDIAYGGCAPLPDRRFALVLELDTEAAMQVLRALAGARAAAAGTDPLPFGLSCSTADSSDRFACPADMRPVLAALPLHRALTVERRPFPHRPGRPCVREEGDSVEVEDPERRPPMSAGIWEVRLKDMGTERAQIVMSWQNPRRGVSHRCW